MVLDYNGLLRELQIESDRLQTLLKTLPPEQWELPTPAEGWAIRDQVSHLAYFDDAAHAAIIEPDRFRRESSELMSGGMDFPDRLVVQFRSLDYEKLLAWFLRSRTELLKALQASDPRARIPWYGPDMSAASSATARLMETWAHGHDIYETLGVPHPTTPGLQSIAHLGVSTFAFVHRLNGKPAPTTPVRVELTSPDGSEVWTWGPDDESLNLVRGSAEDFVLVVTQRRNVIDTALDVCGDVAHEWMRIAQAFAGAPSPARPPLAQTDSEHEVNT
jgi:uncharacterized protein (TIGR03084 family)